MLGIIENITKNLNRQQLLIIVFVLIILVGYTMFMLHKCLNRPKDNHGPLAFNEHFNNNKPEFILFHVDWCGHCKNTVPEFNKIVGSRDDVDIKLLNAEKEGKERAAELEIEGYPTIMLIKDGNVETCNTERTPQAWNAWLNTKLN